MDEDADQVPDVPHTEVTRVYVPMLPAANLRRRYRELTAGKKPERFARSRGLPAPPRVRIIGFTPGQL